jgi:hypothetical protein
VALHGELFASLAGRLPTALAQTKASFEARLQR